jgi:hypothetical protein
MWISIPVPAEGQADLQMALDFLVAISREQIKRHNLPHPYAAGIVYKREPKGRERWQTALHTARVKHGDCEDLAAYLAAWMQVHGQRARAFLRRSDVGYHCLVASGDQILDPSKHLGMKGSS